MVNEVHEGCGADPVLIDLGKKKRKDIRKLAKGKGRLFTRVAEAQARLLAQRGGEGDNAPTVFVVVKQKRRKSPTGWRTRWW